MSLQVHTYLTIDWKSMTYKSFTASCSGWTPPNSTALWWLMVVNEKLEHGGGRGPVVEGEDHSATESRKGQFQDEHMHTAPLVRVSWDPEILWPFRDGTRMSTCTPDPFVRAFQDPKIPWPPQDSARMNTCTCTASPCHSILRSWCFGYTSTHGSSKIHLKCPVSEFYRSSFEYHEAKLYNDLPESIRTIKSTRVFRTALNKLP